MENYLKEITKILSIILITSLSGYAQNHPGLVGLLYDDINLTRISNVWYLESMDSEKANWPSKNDFSARWSGYLKTPENGEVTFHIQADNEFKLNVDGHVILNTWDNSKVSEAKFNAKKDSVYKVTLQYRQIKGASYMRLFWSINGMSRTIIPVSAFFYNSDLEQAARGIFNSKINVDTSDLEFDVESIIDIHTSEDVIAKRQALIDLLWGEAGFPIDRFPDSIITAVSDSNFATLKNLKQIDKLVMEMESGFNSIAYHFIPVKANGSAVIYHQGHGGKFSVGLTTIHAFLEKGYHVFGLSMPLLGLNRKPVVETEFFGKLVVHAHNQMILLTPEQGHPVKYFMEPVAVISNYTQQLKFDHLIMCGLSGGGWTTTLYAALDPRIDISYPVAGTLPHYLRARFFNGNGSLGDYEQRAPEVYRIANYPELYIMGAFGKNRRQLQILNEFDSCCFGGTGYTTYKDIIKERMQSLGSGHFDVFLDSSHRSHQVSEVALEKIFSDLDKGHH